MQGFHLLTTRAVKPVLSKSVTILEVAAVAAAACKRTWFIILVTVSVIMGLLLRAVREGG